MIRNGLSTQINEALKKGDSLRVSTLRLLSSALHNEEIAKQKGLTEEEEIQVVRRQIKQREEAAEAYEKGGRLELAEKEKQEAQVLKEFLPEELSELEIEGLVDQVIEQMSAGGAQDFGKVMGMVMQQVAGRADGSAVAQIVRDRLKS